MKTNKKPILFGAGSGFLLLILYFFILSVANSPEHAFSQFLAMWYWILVLSLGFGLQVGLYFYIFKAIKARKADKPAAIAMAASGSVSTGSMVACCLHHFVDVLPLIGLAGFALFLSRYQIFFLSLGIASNLIGIAMMLEVIQRNQLSEGLLKRILIYDMGKVKKITIIISLILLAAAFFVIYNQNKSGEAVTPEKNGIDLQVKTDSRDGVTFEAGALDFNFGKPQFEIEINTHEGSLDFDLVRISFLEDDLGSKYYPLGWEGAGVGGHHRSGKLLFPEINNQAKTITLSIQDDPDDEARIFIWSL